MKRLKLFIAAIVILALAGACKKSICGDDKDYVYYEVKFKSGKSDWRDTLFVVRTKNEALIQQINEQLTLPVSQRKLVVGTLVQGSGGYNKNASHEFKWHFKEDDWQLADVTIEIYDGRPYTDIDLNLSYWLNTVKRFGPWSSYISRKLPGKPS